MSYSADRYKAKEVGQTSLFGDTADATADLLRNLPQIGEVSAREMLNWEKELLGLYVSSHPIDAVMEQLRDSNITNTLELKSDEMPQDKPVRLVGLIAALRKIPTKNRDMMCIATLEDRFSTIDVVLFPRTWNQYSELMEEGGVVVVSGKFDRSRNDPQIICESVTTQIETVMSDARVLDALANGLSPLPPLQYEEDETQDGNRHVSAYDEPPSFNELPPLDFEDELPPFITEETQPHPLMLPRKLRVRFERLTDEQRDRRRLERLIGVFKAHPGRDQFEIILVAEQVETHLLQFPRLTTHVSEALLRDIGRIDGVKVDQAASVYTP
jgi:hypothetical protein